MVNRKGSGGRTRRNNRTKRGQGRGKGGGGRGRGGGRSLSERFRRFVRGTPDMYTPPSGTRGRRSKRKRGTDKRGKRGKGKRSKGGKDKRRTRTRMRKTRKKNGGSFLPSLFSSTPSISIGDDIKLKDFDINHLQLLPGENQTQKPAPRWSYKVIDSHRKDPTRIKYLKVQREISDPTPIYEILVSNAVKVEPNENRPLVPANWRSGGDL